MVNQNIFIQLWNYKNLSDSFLYQFYSMKILILIKFQNKVLFIGHVPVVKCLVDMESNSLTVQAHLLKIHKTSLRPYNHTQLYNCYERYVRAFI